MNNNTLRLKKGILKQKLILKLDLEDKNPKNNETITIDITIDRLGLWKDDLKRILQYSKKQLKSISAEYVSYIIDKNKSKVITREKMFIEKQIRRV